MGDIGELSNENDSSDDEGLEFDESDEDSLKDEEGGDESQNYSADEAESDSGTMFSDDIEWETDSESESITDEKKENSRPHSKETKCSTNSISGTSSASRKGKSLKKATANLSKFDTDDKNDNESSELNQLKVDEYGEGDTSDEEVT